MGRRLGLLALALALTHAAGATGCRLFERDRDRPLPGEASPERNRTRPGGGGRGGDWLDGPVAGKVGKSRDAGDPAPREPKFDVTKESRGSLGGIVKDPDGRPAKGVSVEYSLADGSDGPGAILEVLSEDNGRFQIYGLKAKKTYMLTARAKIQGRECAGRVFAPTGLPESQKLSIPLSDDLSFPGVSSGGSPGDLPERPSPKIPAGSRPFGTPDTAIPAPPSVAPNRPSNLSGRAGELPSPRASADIGEKDWSPVAPPGGGGGYTPTMPALPPLPGVGRPELRTDGPANPSRPPVTAILGQSGTSPAPVQSQSRSVPIRPRSEFVLVDTLGVEREFPTGRAGELVLLDFMTTSCLPCKKAIPALKDLQSRYGTRGLEVIGVACDEAPPAERRAVASRYQRSQGLNYLLYVEPGREPGALLRRFRVEHYPTLVLLDGEGTTLWQGPPTDIDALDRVIARELIEAKK